MKKLLLMMVAVIATSLLLVACSSGDYNYISAEEVKEKLEANEGLFLLDIQVEEEFEAHHIDGAVATYAYPTNSEEDYAKLAPYVDQFKQSNDLVVIVCPAGGGGATRTYDYYIEQGVPEEQLFILEDGQQGWPYDVVSN